MGTRPRLKPEYLSAKLLAIRERLEFSQSKMARRLDVDSCARISEYEHGTREPNLMVLLRYSKVARVHMETLVNDLVTLAQFREALQKRKSLR
jgi:transcriptional regulator with XRE-family HTH domain